MGRSSAASGAADAAADQYLAAFDISPEVRVQEVRRHVEVQQPAQGRYVGAEGDVQLADNAREELLRDSQIQRTVRLQVERAIHQAGNGEGGASDVPPTEVDLPGRRPFLLVGTEEVRVIRSNERAGAWSSPARRRS